MDKQERFYTENYERLYDYIYRKTFDKYATEDIVQEVFLAALKKNIIETHENAVAWLYQAAAYELSHLYRKRGRDILEEYEVEYTERYEEIELNVFLENVLNSGEFQLVKMNILEGEKEVDIAEDMGISPGNIRIRMYRIKKKLKEYL